MQCSYGLRQTVLQDVMLEGCKKQTKKLTKYVILFNKKYFCEFIDNL